MAGMTGQIAVIITAAVTDSPSRLIVGDTRQNKQGIFLFRNPAACAGFPDPVGTAHQVFRALQVAENHLLSLYPGDSDPFPVPQSLLPQPRHPDFSPDLHIQIQAGRVPVSPAH